MLEKAQDKVVELGLGNVTLKTMDATVMDFGHSEFDSAVATYTISAVPDPVGVLREMNRVVKPGGNIVLLNHFRSERPVVGRLEDLVAPGMHPARMEVEPPARAAPRGRWASSPRSPPRSICSTAGASSSASILK